jgi:hypothetical protein
MAHRLLDAGHVIPAPKRFGIFKGRRNAMKKSTVTCLVIGLTCAMTAAQARAETQTYQVRGFGASGSGYSYDDCSSASFHVSANDQVTHQAGGKPTTGRAAWIGFFYSNWCTDTHSGGFAFVPDVDFSGSLNSAFLNATVTLFSKGEPRRGEEGPEPVATSTAYVSAIWTGTGETFHGLYSSTSHWGRYFSRDRWIGQTRSADLVLQVTIDGVPVTFQGTYGDLGKYNSGSTFVFHR